jgi:Ca-activated chloride channel family protein
VSKPFLVVVCLVAATAGVATQAPISSVLLPSVATASTNSQAVFKTGIELVALSVIVTDPQQHYIGDLSKTDFAVYEDGVQQDVSFFASSDLPLDLALVLDTSSSMSQKLPLVQQAAVNFIRTLRPDDRGAVLAFNNSAKVLSELGSDRERLESAIRQTTAQGSTALYNALYVALRQFEKRAREETDLRRRAIVLLSDGEDTASLITFEEVLKLAKRAGISIYTIALSEEYSLLAHERTYFSQANFSMKTLAQETGALSYFPRKIEELAGVYDRIATELSHQYSLGFTSKNAKRDGAFRRLVVRVPSRPELRSRARLGYFVAPLSGNE